MKNKHIAITKHECHNLLSEYLDEMRGPLGEQETSEVKRIKNELKYCNTNGENIKIWSKKTNEEASGSKRKAEDDTESTRSKFRSSTSSKSVGIAPFLALLPPLSTQLNCTERWLLGDMDLSSELMRVKTKCIDKYNNDEKMRAIEQLFDHKLLEAIKRGMAKPHMLGLLIDGYNCYLYMMKIEHEAIYQMVELDTFSLPKGRNEIHLLKNLLEVIFRVKVFASEAFEDFEAGNGAQSELLPLCRFVVE
ncbi:hypothetical protein A0J61_10065 [Choanephora cucurbitarum]|uniref:Uncharacterized protein n=1 Tax=Choanephora cucurbitarum TaxID=101091 RepID=A0A1C7MYK3_9FUNG|nr:hypothetical protein A0J61_10065 [Choanephora cucurbitarum]